MREGGLPWSADPRDEGRLILRVRAIPGVSRTSSAGLRETQEGPALVVRLAAPPEKGKANDELVAWLASALSIPRSAVILRSGATSRLKILSLPRESEAGLTSLVPC